MSGIFVDTKIKTTVILLTQGELGGDKNIRKTEFTRSISSLGFNYYLYKFPDLKLPFVSLQKLTLAIEKIIRQENITTIISFNPYEITPGFDHPDHNRTGEAARLAAASVLGHRPKLYFWTSHGTPIFQKQRINYFKNSYPSQYQENCPQILGQIGEKYLEVRGSL